MLPLLSLLYLTTIAQADAITLPSVEISAAAPEAGPFEPARVSGAEWEAAGGHPEQALAQIPGVQFSAAGGPGQTRSLFLRGSKAEHTLVLIDGLPVNDPLSPARSFDFSLIPAGGIERVEVKKGPQSVLYGSDALGGVVEIFTREGAASPRAKVELGSFSSRAAEASAEGLRASFFETRGYSAADARQGNSEPDGHRQAQAAWNRAFSLGEKFTLRTQAFYQTARTDTDLRGGPGGDSIGTFTRNTQAGARATLSRPLGTWDFSFSGAAFRRTRFDTTRSAAGDAYRSLSARMEAGLRRESEASSQQYGLLLHQESGQSNQLTHDGRFREGAFFANFARRWERLTLEAGARASHHNQYGSALIYQAGGAYWLAPRQLALRLSQATAFKAPSLYQTYSIYGAEKLRAERSRGEELGLEWQDQQGARAELSFFQNGFRDLVDFAPNPSPGSFYNLGRARTKGVELGANIPFGIFSFTQALSYLSARDRLTGAMLPRRARWSGQAGLAIEKPRWASAGQLRFVGARLDLDPLLYTPVRLPSFFTLSLSGHYLLHPKWKIGLRAENLTGRAYEETAGFGAAPRSFFASLEATL